jgi:hypothetical protein
MIRLQLRCAGEALGTRLGCWRCKRLALARPAIEDGVRPTNNGAGNPHALPVDELLTLLAAGNDWLAVWVLACRAFRARDGLAVRVLTARAFRALDRLAVRILGRRAFRARDRLAVRVLARRAFS